MRAKLRTWIRSWRVWVIVACLAYIGGIYGRGPSIAAVWPLGLEIAKELILLALLVLSWFLLKYLVVPFLMWLQGEKKDGQTDKAKEKFADSLMSVSNAIQSATWISVLVFPLTAFIQAMTRGIDPVAVVVSWWPPPWWSGWHTAVFVGVYFLPLMVSVLFRGRALNLYDKLSPPAPAVVPTAQGTNAQPRIPAEGQTTHASATGSARRGRRPRAKG